MSTVWAVKHRHSLDEIVGQDKAKAVMSTWQTHDPCHMIFHSAKPGTGKTSMAHAMADTLGRPIHVFNASSKKTRGIDFVEEELLPMSRTGNHKQIFLLDEADQLTPAAQSALKGVIENAHGIFILTCNDYSKITEWIKSRCLTVEFAPISADNMKLRLLKIVGKEGVVICDERLSMIVRAHEGDLRASINALQAYHTLPEDKRMPFLHSLFDEGFASQDFLTLCFRDKDFESAHALFKGQDQPRRIIRSIFRYAMQSNAQASSKLVVIDASCTAERDYIMGVEPTIILANFVRMCVNG